MPPWKLRCARACNIYQIPNGVDIDSIAFRRPCPDIAIRPTIRKLFRSTQRTSYTTQVAGSVALRKQLKDEAKVKRAAGSTSTSPYPPSIQQTLKDWELTVGIEIHAQLNTARKLFSREYTVQFRRFELTPQQMQPRLSMTNRIVTLPSSMLRYPGPYPSSRMRP